MNRHYIVRVGKQDYITDGRSYTVNGEVFVPLTTRYWEARKYPTLASAVNASKRKGANMNDEKTIFHVDDRDVWTKIERDGWML